MANSLGHLSSCFMIAEGGSRSNVVTLECGDLTPLSFLPSFGHRISKEKKKESGVKSPHSKWARFATLLSI